LGVAGDFYIDTAALKIYGPKTATAWTTGTSLVGTNGTNGNTLLSGVIAPTAAVGNNGDFYIDTVGFKVYGPKAAGVWPAGLPLK
jgi:hypothetical protein